MAGASLLTLLDDIATILDDVAAMSKVAARKTAGVLGDDLALNAQQVSGVAAERELPVVWAVAKGSMLNKCILVPAALLISAFIPWAITPLLMLGGLFLCFEGFEKVYHGWCHRHGTAGCEAEADARSLVAKTLADLDSLEQFEREKVKGAVRTDFVLSAEIIAISLGVVASQPLMTQFLSLCVIAFAMTLGVYGLVAGIVKLDDVGLYLHRREGQGWLTELGRNLGAGLVKAAPWLMKALTLVGTLAMFMVGGGILTHGVHLLTDGIELAQSWVEGLALVGPVLAWFTPALLNALFGVVAGALSLLCISGLKSLWPVKS